MTSKQKVDYALRQVVTHHDFFGPAAMAMPWQECAEIPTACTDGISIRYNPEFIDGLSKAQTVGLALHELLHPLLGHLERMAYQFREDRFTANKAADYKINNFLSSYNKDVAFPVSLPPDGCVDVEKWGDLSAEVIYKRIKETPPDKPEDGDGDSKSGDGDSKSGDGDSKGGDGDSKSGDGDSKGGDGHPSSCGEFELPTDSSTKTKQGSGAIS